MRLILRLQSTNLANFLACRTNTTCNLQPANLEASDEAFIKVTRFQVPPVVLMGANSIRLSCNYELRDETLHAMKLFKDDKEVSFVTYMHILAGCNN